MNWAVHLYISDLKTLGVYIEMKYGAGYHGIVGLEIWADSHTSQVVKIVAYEQYVEWCN